MTTHERSPDSRTRNHLLSHAAKVLQNLGRGNSAKIMNRYLRPDVTDPKAQTTYGVRTQFQPPTPGYQIAERLHLAAADHHWKKNSAAIAMGIVSNESARHMQLFLIQAALPYDSYDRALANHAPDMLVIEADALAQELGWQHALTLRDVSATVELVTMVQKARAAGITAILIRPAAAHRFPLLSRILDAFDHVIDNPAEITGLLTA
ncbi:MAG: hypothetical protein Q4G49_00610 [Paracoccus sp. (in: a-proteobacteria)]|nr:hypothetical protein [Paracoccus sp. (in: a-proteobacteria)]